MLIFVNKVVAACLAGLGRVFVKDQVSFLKERLEAALERNRRCKERVADYLIKSLIVAEDRRFWNHGGVDVLAMCRALYHILIHRRLQGASTIEQQLVRTLTGYRKLSVKRKLREMILACVLGDFLDKREAAALYLCCAYYGWRMNSLDQACRRMGFDAIGVNRKESADLVARLKYPEPRHASAIYRGLIEKRAADILEKTNQLAV